MWLGVRKIGFLGVAKKKGRSFTARCAEKTSSLATPALQWPHLHGPGLDILEKHGAQQAVFEAVVRRHRIDDPWAGGSAGPATEVGTRGVRIGWGGRGWWCKSSG